MEKQHHLTIYYPGGGSSTVYIGERSGGEVVKKFIVQSEGRKVSVISERNTTISSFFNLPYVINFE